VYEAFLKAYIQKCLHRHINPYSPVQKSLCRVFLQASVEKTVSRHACRLIQSSVCRRILTHVHREVCVWGCSYSYGSVNEKICKGISSRRKHQVVLEIFLYAYTVKSL